MTKAKIRPLEPLKYYALTYIPHGPGDPEVLARSTILQVLEDVAGDRELLEWGTHEAMPEGKIAMGRQGSYIIDPDVRATDFYRRRESKGRKRDVLDLQLD